MAYRLISGYSVDFIEKGSTIIGNWPLSCYDTLDDPWFYIEWDDLLPWRSIFEFAREQLNARQRKELDKIDAHWRANPKDFNKAMSTYHHWSNKKTKMENYVVDENGAPVPIPRSHWWWWPIESGNK